MIVEKTSIHEKQCTIQSIQRYSGIALHTGLRAHITLKPATENTGIRLLRIDLPNQPGIQALASNVINVQRATTIANGLAKVHTVEHVLAALYAYGIDNAIIAMDGPEPPIADGSSDIYAQMIQEAGIRRQNSPRRYLHVHKPIWIDDHGSRLIVIPSDNYQISCTVQYEWSPLITQYLSLGISRVNFLSELCRARTFCYYEDIEPLMVNGLIKGGSLDNAVIIKDGAIIAKERLYYPDEFVRHKILDIIGDLSLIGARLIGHIIAIRPGHSINVRLAKKIINLLKEKKGMKRDDKMANP